MHCFRHTSALSHTPSNSTTEAFSSTSPLPLSHWRVGARVTLPSGPFEYNSTNSLETGIPPSIGWFIGNIQAADSRWPLSSKSSSSVPPLKPLATPSYMQENFCGIGCTPMGFSGNATDAAWRNLNKLTMGFPAFPAVPSQSCPPQLLPRDLMFSIFFQSSVMV